MNDFQQLHLGWIRESNLIEGVDDETADQDCLEAWKRFTESDLDIGSILRCHWDIMRRKAHKIAGEYRKHAVGIYQGARLIYSAPDWKLVPNLMKDWLVRHEKDSTWDEIKFGHVIFERIHPFEDGNGRVGRMIMNWQRVKAGMEPLCIYAEKRGEYYQWFKEFDFKKGDKWKAAVKKSTVL